LGAVDDARPFEHESFSFVVDFNGTRNNHHAAIKDGELIRLVL